MLSVKTMKHQACQPEKHRQMHIRHQCHMLNGVPMYVLALWAVGLGYCACLSVVPNRPWPGHGVSQSTGLLCQHEQNLHLNLVVDRLSHMPLLSHAKLC